MTRNRMEAFSDGVLAIIITIMVLKLQVPESTDLNGLKEMFPTFIAYIISFLYVGIYWANHHHLVSAITSVSGVVLWKNLHWVFWMSLIPTATEWVGLHPFTKIPSLMYGIILFMCAISYHILQYEILKIHGKDSKLHKNIGKDIKGKVSIVSYALAMIFSLYIPIIAYLIYLGTALIWLMPDIRLENSLKE